ncbi:ATP-binding protein [Flavobacterium gelidilacus]|uniref:ATP-binding protein n=1 Tax=Flavobacterium gelidilacus TaxID=206041 RepID=UPI0003FA29A7|nr:ATP-binding protein [Flavobacterium gelidilacus]
MSPMEIGKVLESSPNTISIQIENTTVFEANKKKLQIGKYVEISDGNLNKVVAIIQNIKSTVVEKSGDLKFILQTQPIGYIESETFFRGTSLIPSPTEPVYVMEETTMGLIYSSNKDYNFPFGKLVQNNGVEFKIDANKFFGKHIALVGSTGSGKSCTVSKILQDVVGISNGKNMNIQSQKNSHIIIFDIHSEYKSAFELQSDENFTLNILDADNLMLPYWLMNSEELESLFIEGNENNHHNQVSQFKRAVILNKEKHNPTLKDKVNYDTPVYFNIEEVYTYIWNLNHEVVSKLVGENCPKLSDTTLIKDSEKLLYFDDKLDFVVQSTAAATKASNGAFHGEFNRFISRLETKLSDKRLDFLLQSKKADGSSHNSEDFGDVLKQFLGYLDKSNVTIIDLSGIPFEVLSITVSLVSRLVFDFAFHYSKIKHATNDFNDIPFMIVCEEAHNYIPKTGGAEYKASKKSIERIAKEGRKYGLSLMVVSQRPSEVSETIFSQCNNFISLRLTNVNDQNYIKSLMPENSNAIADILPNLSSGECLIVGDATLMPSVVRLDMPNPQPKSQSIKFQDEWQKDWKDASFDDVIKRWKKE